MSDAESSNGLQAVTGLEEDALWRAYFADSPVGQVVTLPDGRLARVNRAFADMLGYEPEELDGRSFTQITHPDDLEQSLLAVANMLAKVGERMMFEKRYITKQGDVVWGLVNTRLHRDPTGRPVCFMTHVADITERKRIEEAHRTAQAQTEAILAATADGILAVDRHGRVVRTNDRFAELWKIPRELIEQGDDNALLGYVLEQLRDPEAFLEKVRRLYGGTEESWDTLEFHDGRIFERYSAPMYQDGHLSGRIWSFRDITARRRVEERLSERNREIEALVRAISHDMRSPLLTIKGFVGMLEEDVGSGDPASILNDIGLIQDATDRMLRLLEDLLDYWNLGRSTEPIVETPLKELVDDALAVVGTELLQAGAYVTVEDAPLIVKGRKRELVRVFQNLLENAAKYVGDCPEPHVTIGWEVADAADPDRSATPAARGPEPLGPRCVIFVRDNGKGFAPEAKDKLFLPFERLNRSVPGSGLGLAGVRKVVESHGGLVWGDSKGDGTGATFYISLPGSRTPDGGTGNPSRFSSS